MKRTRRARGAKRKRAGKAAPGGLARTLAEGLRHHRAGRGRQAQALYARVLAAEPDNSEALHHMAVLALQGGAPDEAARLLRRAIAARADDAEAHNNLGFLLRGKGATGEAIACFRRAVAIRPDYAEAHYNLGNALKAADRLEEAAVAFEAACRANPGHAPSHNNLGGVLRELGRLEEAAARLRRAVALDPAYEKAHFNLAAVLRLQGEADESLACYHRALELNPNDVRIHRAIGNRMMEKGAMEEATGWYRRALALDPADAETYRYFARIRHFEAGDPDLARMRELLARPDLPDAAAMHLCFALAKANEDLERYDDAFAMLTRANALARATRQFDIDEAETVADEMIETVDRAYLAARAGAGCDSRMPIFVLGMPRSGTSLVEQILSAHPRVHGAGEVDFLRPALLEGFSPETGETLAAFLKARTGADLGRRGAAYRARLEARAPGAERITDKYLTNFWCIGLIGLMLPNARVVHCARDPLDTCVSCYRNLFPGGVDFGYDLTELGRYYRVYDRLMAHWRGLMPGFVLDLRYEELVARPEREIRRLLDFCGLAWDERVLAFHHNPRSVITASAAQVRRPMFASSIGGWRRYAAHLGPLREALGPLAGGRATDGGRPEDAESPGIY